MANPRMTAEIGRVLGGRYRLVAPIGMGASAQVYLADDVRLRRRVALKMLHDALADDAEFLRRFRAEARAAAALSHPNVMAVYDWGDDEVAFIVTEYLDGGSLRALLDRGEPLSPSQALVVGLEATRALDYAHRRGFVHRDVKPANLLFGEEQRLRIADFGLARALAEAAWTEPQGAMLGTARYASPEQAKGEKLDGKADVYALALVLVEAVTGEVPFAADTTIGTLMARIDRQLEVPDSLGPLQAVLTRAGHPDPKHRIDARALAAGLLRAAKALPKPAALPLAGALRSAGEVVVDHDPTAHGPTGEVASVPADDLDLTADDLDLDPPDWVNRAEPAGRVESSDDASDVEVEAEAEAEVEADGVDVDQEADTGGPDPDEASDHGDDSDDSDDSDDRVDPAVAPGAEPELAPVLDLGEPVGAPSIDGDDDGDRNGDGDDGGGSAGLGPTAPEDEQVHRVVEPALSVAVTAPDRELVGAGVGVALAGTGPSSFDAPEPDAADDGTAGDPHVIDLTEGSERSEEPPADEPRRRHQRRWPWAVLVVVVLAGGGGVAAAAVADREPAVPERLVVLPVPALANRKQADAEAIAAAAGWRTSVVTERRDGTTRGQVLATDPEPGTRLAPGGSVELTVSAGQTEVDVPTDLAGKPLPDATAVLAFSGLQAATGEERFNELIGAGGVITTAGGTPPRLERGSTVTLVVSKGPEPRTVPGVAGETQAEAAEALEALRLQVAVDPQFNDSVAEGRVVSQDPPPGEEVSRGAPVTLVVSKGPELVPVPGLAGESQAGATEAVEALGLDVAVDPQFSDNVNEGQVVSQDPPRGEEVLPGATVTIEVSMGRNLVSVPGVAGDSQTGATEALEALGLEVAVDPQFSDTVDEGQVVSQDPPRGEEVLPGATVTIEVSMGRNLVSVPGVAGDSQTEATAALEARGLDVAVDRQFNDTVDAGRVVSQNPRRTEGVPPGTTVTIEVSRGPSGNSDPDG